MKKIIFLFAAIAALTSCTITKRHYAPGYHVEFKSLRSKEVAVKPTEETVVTNDGSTNDKNLSKDQVFVQSNSAIGRNSTSMQVDEFAMNQETLAPEELVYSEAQSVTENQIVFSNDLIKSSEKEVTEAPVLTAPTGDINTIALVGFCLSLFSLFALPGLICSIIGLKQIKEGKGEGKGLAIAGIVLGALWIVFWVLYVVAVVLINSGY